jgi:parallel beta-helix repeat protein
MRALGRVTMRAALLFIAAVPFAEAAVIFVNGAATGANNGSSWADAYVSLQSGLSAAGSSDEIWVAAATYKPTATADRTISFALKNGVGVYGGFNGTETQRSQRNPAVNVTILSGDIGTPGTATDNSYHVVTADGTVASTGVLDGFTITAGQADAASAPNERGGGMWDNGGAPTLGNLIFSTNFANFEGGGMRVTSGAPTLTHCTFVANVVAFGGAGGGFKSGGRSIVTATDCSFLSNQISGASVGSGGVESGGGMTLVNCVIAQNAPDGLDLIADGNTLENCTIAGNAAYGVALITSSSNSMTNTIVWGNSVAGVFNDGLSVVSVSYCDTQDALTGTGNIFADPVFRGFPADLRLGTPSPAVDAGNNGAVPVGVTTDLSGLPRFFDDPAVPDTGAGTPPIVDMGAYERVPLSVTAPSDLSLCSGTDAVFSVTAQGAPTLTYLWLEGGIPLSNGGRISGATASQLTIMSTVPGDSGSYSVVVTDGFGQMVTSSAATLTVDNQPALPVIVAPESVGVGSTGVVVSVTNHAGSTYAWTLPGGTITAGQGLNQITFDAGAPGTTMQAGVVESAGSCASPEATDLIQVDFLDVPPADPFHDYVIKIARNGVTAGCGGGNYCRNASVTRAQMAVFLLKAEHGSTYVPPTCTGIFGDVICPSAFANWIERLSAEGITGGCGGGNYCPSNPVTRAQMAVFLLKTEHGSTYVPPVCTGRFLDVTCPSAFADWIEQLFNEGVTGGCGGGNYCPNNPNTRGQMAVFLSKTFNLP